MNVNGEVDAVLSIAGDRQVLKPRYDRSKLVPSVVHIGVGGFHRAHQLVYFDDLAESGEVEWGVTGVGLRSWEIGDVLAAQDGLFTVVEREENAATARVVGSLVRYLYAPSDPEAVLRVLADPRTRLVTLTVTGGGYYAREDGSFDVDDEWIQHDLQNRVEPMTMVGLLVEGLRRRRDAGTGPFTVLSCDNLPSSGPAARTAVTSFAQLLDPDLARWIDEQVTFPSSMVDRITPETTPKARDAVQRDWGVKDRWPVVTESFRQWVIEDSFCAGRPPLDTVGAQFVADVTPYKLIKSRMLNAGHSALGYLGRLGGYDTTASAMKDEGLVRVIEKMLGEEVAPLLPVLPDLHLDDYRRATLRRFSNPAIADSLDRLCRRGSVKMPSYLLPSLREARANGGPHTMLTFATAGWLRYLRGVDFAGAPLTVDDPIADELCALAEQGGGDPRPLLGRRDIFGELVDDEELVEELTVALRELSEQGLSAVVERGAA